MKREAWRARERSVPISTSLTLSPDGLLLGAGTIIVASAALRRLQSLKGREAQVLALLSAAQGTPVGANVLGNIERAAKSWREGDDCLAHIHLTHSGLDLSREPRAAACRLFVADRVMREGVSADAVLQAVARLRAKTDPVAKDYNPDQPRVPAGSGRTSGQWTADASDGDANSAKPAAEPNSHLAALAASAESFLADLSEAKLESLSEFASRLMGPVGAAAAAFGLLFIPSPNELRAEGEVPEIPGLRYAWSRDETTLHLTYDDGIGKERTVSAQLEDDAFRDSIGNIIARVLPSGSLVVDQALVLPDRANDNQPRLCPIPGPDRPDERGREYEDYVKSHVNPFDTTPRYWGFQLINPMNGEMVRYDDCQHATGVMVEAKGPVYAKLLTYDWGRESISGDWLAQSARQLAAAGARPVRWYFAEPRATEFARKLFRDADAGRELIDLVDLPWP